LIIFFYFYRKIVKKYIMEFVIALITLTFLEIVLGVDNIIFVSIVTNKLPHDQRPKARFIGLSMALIFRILLLVLVVWVLHHLTDPFFPMDGMTKEEVIEKIRSSNFIDSLPYVWHAIGVRELVLFVGGLFLLAKSVSEIHHKMEDAASVEVKQGKATMGKIITQIILLDIVFSFDSILTAVGITDNLPAMISAVTAAMIVMLLFSKKIAEYISSRPTLEILALSFLILIGFMLVLDSVHIEVPKGYIYFAVFFSLIVEVINIRFRRKHDETEHLRHIAEQEKKSE